MNSSNGTSAIPRRAAALWAATLVCAGTAAAQAWDVHLIDDAAATWAAPRAVLSGGIVVGLGFPPGATDQQAVVWDGSANTVLPLPAGHTLGEATGINAAGLVVGTSAEVVQQGQLTFFFTHAVLWENGVVRPVSAFQPAGGLDLLESVDLNSAGQILGRGRDASIPALRSWIVTGGLLTEIAIDDPTGLNEAGAMCGSSGGSDHAFHWEAGALTDLHLTAGVAGVVSHAHDLNDAGAVVGSADFDPGGPQWERAALWQAGAVTDLGTLGGETSTAFGVNDRGEVVGTSSTGQLTIRATLWTGGILHDLNDLIPAGSGWTLLVARDVAEDGRIVGEGAFNGSLRTFELVPDCEGCLSYCVSLPNSTGAAAAMDSSGWESVSANAFGLRASPLPPQQFGLFFYGAAQIQVPLGDGFRCVGGPTLHRLPVVQADAAGVLATSVDFTAPTLPGGAILAGSTWNFQAWYRDPAAGGTGSNLSDGLAVTFLP